MLQTSLVRDSIAIERPKRDFVPRLLLLTQITKSVGLADRNESAVCAQIFAVGGVGRTSYLLGCMLLLTVVVVVCLLLHRASAQSHSS